MRKTFTEFLKEIDQPSLLTIAKELIETLNREELEDMCFCLAAERADMATAICPAFRKHLHENGYAEDSSDFLDYIYSERSSEEDETQEENYE